MVVRLWVRVVLVVPPGVGGPVAPAARAGGGGAVPPPLVSPFVYTCRGCGAIKVDRTGVCCAAQEAFEAAAKTLHSKMGDHMDAVKKQSAQVKATQKQHISPMNAMRKSRRAS